MSNLMNYHIKQLAKEEVNQAFSNGKKGDFRAPNINQFNLNNYGAIPNILSQNQSINKTGLNIVKNNLPTQQSQRGNADYNESVLKSTLRNYKSNNQEVTDKITNVGNTNSNSKALLRGLSYDEVLSKLNGVQIDKSSNASTTNSNTFHPQNNLYKPVPQTNVNQNQFNKNMTNLIGNYPPYNSNPIIGTGHNENNSHGNVKLAPITSTVKQPLSSINQIKTSLQVNENKGTELKGRKPISSEFKIQESLVKNHSKNNLPIVNQSQQHPPSNEIIKVAPTPPKSQYQSYTKFSSVREFSSKEEPNSYWRDYMEDFHLNIDKFMGNENLGLFILFDGHGGHETSSFLVEKLPITIENNLKGIKDFKDSSKVEHALKESFEQLDKIIASSSWGEFSGSTACVVLTFKEAVGSDKHNYTIYSANVGDSRTVLINKEKGIATRLSYDHKATDPSEIMRVKNGGGLIFNGRVLGQLAVTRAFGDFNLKKQGINVNPFLKRVLSPGDEYIIIASDGVWDVLEDQEIVSIARVYGSNSNELANAILGIALERGSTDNITVSVILL